MKGEQLDTEDWRAIRRTQQARRAANRENGAAILTENKVEFELKGDGSGSHLIVKHAGKVVDYWPGTGKWIDRDFRGRHERGVFRLLNYLGVRL